MNRAGGSVLILALWSLFFLAAIALAVGSYVSAGLTVAEHVQSRLRLDAVAQAGVERAVMEAMCRATNGWDGTAPDAWNRDESAFRGALPGGTYEVVWGDLDGDRGRTNRVGILGEEARVNVNTATARLLEALFSRAGLKGDLAGLAAAVVSRRQTVGGSDASLTGKTESGYDATLKRPYGSVAELAVVPGMTGEALAIVAPYLTVYGTGKLNINAASTMAMASLADATGAGTRAARDSLVEKVRRYRAAGRRFVEPSVEAVVGRLSEFGALTQEETAVLMAMLPELTVSSTCFRGVSVGRTATGRGEERQIEFVFDVRRRCRVAWRQD